MLTKLEAEGFKNLLGLNVEFGPFTCIAGESGAGKSNVFDLIQLLSLLADRSLMEAAQEVRSTRDERTGDPRDMFWNGHQRDNLQMYLAAEMIVPRHVEDDFGRPTSASITFLRYELSIGYDPPHGLERQGRLLLLSESLRHINIGDAPRRLGFPHSPVHFRKNVITGRRSGQAFISTTGHDGDAVITVHQDGGSRGQPRKASAARAPATVVSTVTGADDPTILAARREMQSWKRLALEPSALRASDRYTDPQVMAPNGRHLAAALYRVATSLSDDDPGEVRNVYARVASRLASLTDIRVRRVYVDPDDARELLTLKLVEAPGTEISARSLSEGTLRFLALCVMREDPSVTGLVCMEEPENGIHPANIRAMVELVRELAVDPQLAPGVDNPLRQVIVNTHSPAVVQLVEPDDLLFASVGRVSGPDGSRARGLRLRPITGSWRALRSEKEVAPVDKLDLLPYLSGPPEPLLSLAEG
ncbi:MAG: AAA family ATPase [Egibacteraceae bacterium]